MKSEKPLMIILGLGVLYAALNYKKFKLPTKPVMLETNGFAVSPIKSEAITYV